MEEKSGCRSKSIVKKTTKWVWEEKSKQKTPDGKLKVMHGGGNKFTIPA